MTRGLRARIDYFKKQAQRNELKSIECGLLISAYY